MLANRVVLGIALLLAVGGDAFAFEYVWLTDTEVRAFGDQNCWTEFQWAGLTIRSNSSICVCGETSAYFITADTICGDGTFLGRQPVERAPVYPFPDSLGYLLRYATRYQIPGASWFVDIGGSTVRYHAWDTGQPIDTLQNPLWTAVPIVGSPFMIYFDGPVWVQGRMAGQMVIGCSHDIRIVDNLTYVDADQYGRIPVQSPNYLIVASERSIVIGNTPQNGRENCNGGGRDNPNQNACGIIISAHLVALNGSFTFEDQNDPDSGYVCDCEPDERGYVHLFGSIAQRQAGYLYRLNNGGTGYVEDYRFDSRALVMPDYVFFPPTEEESTDTLDFGEIELGEAVWDTAHVYRYYDYQYYGAYATHPFVLGQVTPNYGNHFRLPIRFTPQAEGTYSGVLTVILAGDPLEIVLRGRGVRGTGAEDDLDLLPQELSLSVFPNPFNSQAEIRYELPSLGPAELRLYDTLGRTVREWTLSSEPRGTINLNAAALSSGLYFVGLSQNTRIVTQKLLHIQ